MANVKASTEYKREHKADYGHEKLEILYEDQWIVIVNKPTGMLSVPYPGSKARTAQSVLEEMLRKSGSAKHKPYVVHRLDRDTSGVMMFAMTEAAQKKIMDSWHQMVTERLYHAVAENPRDKSKMLPPSGLIDDPLAFNSHNIGFVPKADDKPSKSAKGENADSIYGRNLEGHGDNLKFKTVAARTNYTIVEKGPTHTLFELSLDTGKKNQIRAHLSSKGYPLAGDENYRAHTDYFGRLCLHARTLEFVHPFTGKEMKFEVPEDPQWLEYVKKGDFKPRTPVWEKEFKSQRSAKKAKADDIDLGQKRLSRKDKAHMNFIQQGKAHR